MSPPIPGIAAVNAIPDFAGTGRNHNFRYNVRAIGNISVSQVNSGNVRTKTVIVASSHLRPGKSVIVRMQKRARLPPDPDILATAGIT